ncbi:MAG: phosphatase PAP2 family protein [Deltaproteobacteria bacterium]
MKEIIKKNKIFIFPYLLLSAIILFILLFYDKKSGHLMLTSVHNMYLDVFFSTITHLGDGIFVIVAGVLFLLINIRKGLQILISYTLAGIFVQLLKNTIFEDFNRPYKYFDDPSVLHIVDGVNIHIYNSFPSGHTASAFALFFSICLFIDNKYIKAASLLIASLVAYSRVYLSQHFLVDIWAGSATGIIFALIIWTFLYRKNKKFLNRSVFF